MYTQKQSPASRSFLLPTPETSTFSPAGHKLQALFLQVASRGSARPFLDRSLAWGRAGHTAQTHTPRSDQDTSFPGDGQWPACPSAPGDGGTELTWLPTDVRVTFVRNGGPSCLFQALFWDPRNPHPEIQVTHSLEDGQTPTLTSLGEILRSERTSNLPGVTQLFLLPD